MFKVHWNDAKGSHTLTADETDCRQLFGIMVRQGVKGHVESVILENETGNFIDTWGT